MKEPCASLDFLFCRCKNLAIFIYICILKLIIFKAVQKMTKAEIASEIAKTTGIDKAAVVTVIEQFMTVVKDSLAHGENVYLRGFGSFVVKQRAEKTARNISKNTTLVIPAHNIPAFKPANCFKEEVAK
jgi:DNA-binding protein HU-beta